MENLIYMSQSSYLIISEVKRGDSTFLLSSKRQSIWGTASGGRRQSGTVKPVSRNHVTNIFWWNRIPWIIWYLQIRLYGSCKGEESFGEISCHWFIQSNKNRTCVLLVLHPIKFDEPSAHLSLLQLLLWTKISVSLKKNPKLWNLPTFFLIPPPKHLNSNNSPRGCLWAAPLCSLMVNWCFLLV